MLTERLSGKAERSAGFHGKKRSPAMKYHCTVIANLVMRKEDVRKDSETRKGALPLTCLSNLATFTALLYHACLLRTFRVLLCACAPGTNSARTTLSTGKCRDENYLTTVLICDRWRRAISEQIVVKSFSQYISCPLPARNRA